MVDWNTRVLCTADVKVLRGGNTYELKGAFDLPLYYRVNDWVDLQWNRYLL